MNGCVAKGSKDSSGGDCTIFESAVVRVAVCAGAGDGGWSPHDSIFIYSGSRNHTRNLYLPVIRMQIVTAKLHARARAYWNERRRFRDS